MHIIDISLLVIFLSAMIIGYKVGFISAALTWIGFFATLLMIGRLVPMVKYGIMIRFSIGDFLASIFSYLLIVVMIAILFTLLKKLINALSKSLKLTFLNRIVGAVFGFFNVMMVIAVLLFFINSIPFLKTNQEKFKESVIITEIYRLYDYIRYDIRDKIPDNFFN
ncbi:MAG: CvpA family protein [Candidatus Cloacimonetes bacterium]|nr:CvpA family protein [Candidatus Cloacimonadota bacterium]